MQCWHVNTVLSVSFSAVPTATCSEQLVALQDSRNDKGSQSRHIHLIPFNSPSLDTDWYMPLALLLHVKKNTATNWVANSCHCNNAECTAYCRPHKTLSRHQSHHVTDDAGHQQTRLLMLAISRWLRVWGAAVQQLQSILRNRWVALMARVSRSTISCTNACLICALLAGTDHIHSNSCTNAHRPTWRLPLNKQCRLAIIISTTINWRLKDPDKVPPCCPPHANNTSFNSTSQWSRLTPGRRGVFRDAACRARRPPTSPTTPTVSGVVSCPRRLAQIWL